MYSSLDRIDIVTKGPDGRRSFLQTDHRTAAEIEAEPDLSVLFALTRVLNPKRMAKDEDPEPAVVYVFSEGDPPAFLRRAVVAAGGLIRVGDEVMPPDGPADTEQVLRLLTDAFAGLARSVADRHGVALDFAGLRAVEPTLADQAGDPEEDEISYWTAVMELGGFAGEVLRASNDGRWMLNEAGSLPFALEADFEASRATVNPLGKAIKRFENGEEDSLVSLVHIIQTGR